MNLVGEESNSKITLKYVIFEGTLQKKKWENAMTIDRYSWGYRRNARIADFLTLHELLSEIASTVR